MGTWFDCIAAVSLELTFFFYKLFNTNLFDQFCFFYMCCPWECDGKRFVSCFLFSFKEAAFWFPIICFILKNKRLFAEVAHLYVLLTWIWLVARSTCAGKVIFCILPEYCFQIDFFDLLSVHYLVLRFFFFFLAFQTVAIDICHMWSLLSWLTTFSELLDGWLIS